MEGEGPGLEAGCGVPRLLSLTPPPPPSSFSAQLCQDGGGDGSGRSGSAGKRRWTEGGLSSSLCFFLSLSPPVSSVPCLGFLLRGAR